ncbi:uncharacterized protein LOC110852473 isoform X2 [Folsomia candida]|uniref:uncharacterized protein LOC110852473 isoform X2 n=1 Tax=Folsomia candida TaxID=158441 RepID=UPI000B901205|nr:uncharacterized protein LOC110852473 isoform X2 [Folsomia candida]
MVDRFLVFLLKVTGSVFVIVIILVFICSTLLIRFIKWKQRRKKGSRRISSHHHRNRRVVVGHSHTHDTANQLEGYLVENSAETGSTGKVTPEDVPPLYDSPPDYHSLFPTTSKEAQQKLILDDMRIVNEVLSLVTSATTSAPSFNHDDEQGYSQPTNGTGTSV